MANVKAIEKNVKIIEKATDKKVEVAKPVEKKVETVKADVVVKPVEKKEEPVKEVAPKKAPADKKAPEAKKKAEAPKKVEAPKKAEAPKKEAVAKKAAAAPTKKEEPKSTVTVEYMGKVIDTKNVIDAAKKAFKKANKSVEIKTLDVYVKPEESVAYYVVNGVGSDDYKVIL